MIKQFVDFIEAATMLGTDVEGLRQGFELGLAEQLPAYVYSRSGTFLATIRGAGVVATTASIHDPLQWSVTLPNGSAFTAMDWTQISKLGDTFADVDDSEQTQSVTGLPVTFNLQGFFRVFPYDLRRAARDGRFGMPSVAPASWWTSDSPVRRAAAGYPTVRFDLLATRLDGYLDMPEVGDLWLRVSDIGAFLARDETPTIKAETAERPLDERERGSMLRIIRALDAMAKLPDRGAATPIEMQLQKLGFKKPSEATIRKVIEQARALEPDEKPQ